MQIILTRGNVGGHHIDVWEIYSTRMPGRNTGLRHDKQNNRVAGTRKTILFWLESLETGNGTDLWAAPALENPPTIGGMNYTKEELEMVFPFRIMQALRAGRRTVAVLHTSRPERSTRGGILYGTTCYLGLAG